ncbi:MAG: hypothetical protein ACRDF8_02085, partial [Chloroflexota bacterium]
MFLSNKSALAASLVKAPSPAQGSLYQQLTGSSIVGNFASWLNGQQHANANPLPRPLQDFVSNFGPQAPIVPWPIDSPQPSGRPAPRRYEYDVSYNLPHFPGGGKLVSFQELRRVADSYSVARAAINIRVREICGLEWDIAPSASAHEQLRGDKAALQDFKTRRDEAVAFWSRPDPDYNDYQTWLAAGLDDLFVYDAWALYLHASREPGAGPFGSSLAALDLLDGTTLYPLVDVRGSTPRPPDPAYQQYLYGAPRSDLMPVISPADQLPDAEYAADQLQYMRYYARSWTKYGYSPLEQAIIPIRTGIKRQEWALDFYTEGSMPAMMVVCPPEYTPTQVRQLQDVLNMAAGDVAQKWKIRCLPANSKTEQMRPAELANAADSAVIEQVLMMFDVKPHEVGILPGGRTSGMGGRGMHEAQQAATKRTASRPLARWLEAQFNRIIQN